MVAATKFDPSRGCEFSTVALEWMWAECSRELHRRRKAKNKGVWVSSFDGDEDAPIDPPDDTEHDEATADEISHARSRVHNAMFSVLSKTEREVIRSRFGIGWEEAATLDETKVRCGLDVVKERVRQIQQVALSKLRVALTERELVQS